MECHYGWSDTSEDDGRCRRHPMPPLHGVCPACLRECLSLLCPDCASPRPSCSCQPSSASTSTSTSASAAILSTSDHAAIGTVGTVAPMSYFISAEPSLRRSRSAAIPFLRSRPSDACRAAPAPVPAPPDDERPRLSISKLLHLWVFRREKSKIGGDGEAERVEAKGIAERLYRSRSVGASCRPPEPPSAGGGGKGRGWHFPSPIKAFRQSKADKILQQRSPLCRG